MMQLHKIHKSDSTEDNLKTNVRTSSLFPMSPSRPTSCAELMLMPSSETTEGHADTRETTHLERSLATCTGRVAMELSSGNLPWRYRAMGLR